MYSKGKKKNENAELIATSSEHEKKKNCKQ
jgi:hypothetical protein